MHSTVSKSVALGRSNILITDAYSGEKQCTRPEKYVENRGRLRAPDEV
jgi:hypothetical protein